MTKLDKGARQRHRAIDDGKDGTQTIEAERVIFAVGIVGNVENLGLEKLGREDRDAAHIVADGLGKTNVPRLYAIGDVAGPPWLAHKASHEGVICVEAIKGLAPASARQAHDPRLHLLASAGRQRRPDRSGGEGRRAARFKVGRFPFIGNGKAIALGEDQRARQDDLRRRDRASSSAPTWSART